MKLHLATFYLVVVACSVAVVVAGDLDFGDPAKLPPSPAGAVGYPSRNANLDALPGFVNPPHGYGEIPFYWWLGDTLTKERLTWQLDQLSDKGIVSLQINYADSDRDTGGYGIGHGSGLTYPSDPPLFSDAWWELFKWFAAEAKKRGMSVSLSDYTLGMVGNGYWIDDILKKYPDMHGAKLGFAAQNVDGGKEFVWELPKETISATAYRIEGNAIATGSGVDLRSKIDEGRTLRWTPTAGKWQVVAVHSHTVLSSINPLDPRLGPEVIKHFLQRLEDHLPGELKKTLNGFFTDELSFGIRGNLWHTRFAEEFRKRKGYDLVPELAALFVDIGPRTPKVRLDYNDVKVALTEESYFKPIFDWHHQRGLLYGCDNGGRGHTVDDFGDYFRTHRWTLGAGNDQPYLAHDVVRTKVQSSISHLYQRPRTWLEGYYGSGWGTTPEQLTQASVENYVMGSNLQVLHGLYYTTHGGWWEWAPPCNHFRMPYWAHMKTWMKWSERLCYLLSQGVHRCDVAIIYPVAPMQAGMDGKTSVDTAFGLGNHLFSQGIDFDFIDTESLARATVEDKQLKVSGEAYRVLVLPAMRAVHYATMLKAAEFKRGGGLVIALGSLPEASDRIGRNDPQLDALVKEVFPSPLASNEQVSKAIAKSFPRDFSGQGRVLHRKIGVRDIYFVCGATQNAECSFRASGKVELWDPWTGQVRTLPVIEQTAQSTRLRMPLTEQESQLIVFSPGTPLVDDSILHGTGETIAITGDWEFELQPTMNNRFGDFRWPPTDTIIGAEARRFLYAEEPVNGSASMVKEYQKPDFDDSKWTTVTSSFGQKFWKLGPLPENVDCTALEAQLASLEKVDPSVPVEFGGTKHAWQPYDFSWRWGIEGDPGTQGYHGLKGKLSDDFISLGRLDLGPVKCIIGDSIYHKEPGGSRYYLWTSVVSDKEQPARLLVDGNRPSSAWLNQTRVKKTPGQVKVKVGSNPLLLRYDTVGRGYAVVEAGQADPAHDEPAMFSNNAKLIWAPHEQGVAADRFFRKSFEVKAPVVKARLRITCDDNHTAYLDGKRIGSGKSRHRVQEYDLTRLLEPGGHVLAVAARNHGGSAGLIAELVVEYKKALSQNLATDSTWRFARSDEIGWIEVGYDDSAWGRVEKVADYENISWAKQPAGALRLDPRCASCALTLGDHPLAMKWYGNPKILPFDTRPQVPQPAGWYRFTSPPGLRAMTIPTRGNKVQVWVDGKEQAVTKSKGADCWLAAVSPPPVACAKVAVRIEQQRGDDGGAALYEPIAFDCGTGNITLGDWSQIDGLASYSGGAWYRKTISLTPEQLQGRLALQLGQVAASAEVRVNGQLAGIRMTPPWTVDISGFVKSGENRIEILVYNTLANHYLTIPTRYRGSPISGLLGPVSIKLQKEKR